MSDHEPARASGRSRRIGGGVSVVAIAIVLFVALAVLEPAMPDRIVILTGAEGGAYHALGERYAVELRRRGLEVDVVATRGVSDSLRRLASGGREMVSLAPSTVGRAHGAEFDPSQFVSLGSVGFEPVWLFHQSDLEVERIPDLAGLAVATAGEGTVSDFVAKVLIEQNGVAETVEIDSYADRNVTTLAEDLVTGRIEAGFVTGSPSAPLVKRLLEADGLTFLSFDRAEAYAALMPDVTTLVAPEGVFDLARNSPPQQAELLSVTTNLVALEGLHRAIAPVLLDVVSSLPREKDYFSTDVSFPNERNLAFTLEQSSKRYLHQGEVGLSKYLPYKVTRYLNHLGFVVLPILALTFLLLKVTPAAMKIWGKVKLVGLLKQLEAVEKGHAAGEDSSKLLADLDRIDRASAGLFVPRSTVHDYIDIRQFLHDMRERVESGPEA